MRPETWYEGRTSLELLRGAGWAWIGLRSGDGLNRLHSDLLVVLDRLFIELRWAGTRRVALSGAGWMAGRGHHFSAGADLHEVGLLDAVSADPFSRRGQRVMTHLLWPGWRSLTVISGVAMGGGCDLALHGQERWAVAADSSGKGGLRLAHPAAKHGILTGFGGTVRLPELLGHHGANRLFRGFETWDEAAALQAGAVHRVVVPTAVGSEVHVWLGQDSARS
ncbi:MAG: enoyl-CoA hydratase/isomerase family protein [Holophagaceae bacterium]